MVSTATPACSAIASIVVPAYPRSKKRTRAASAICSRVWRACALRRVELYLRVGGVFKISKTPFQYMVSILNILILYQIRYILSS